MRFFFCPVRQNLKIYLFGMHLGEVMGVRVLAEEIPSQFKDMAQPSINFVIRNLEDRFICMWINA